MSLVAALVPLALPAQTPNQGNQVVNRIIDEGFNRSELAETVAYLTDRIGGRLTNSPQMRAAEQWTQQQFTAWGLQNVHAEGYAHRVNQTPRLPGFELAAEDYRQLARLAIAGAEPILELVSVVSYHDEDRNAYNVFADLPGRDASAGFVMSRTSTAASPPTARRTTRRARRS